MAKNGTSNHGTGLDAQRLTADNLSGIPRRNNIMFLSDYLQEQRSYSKGYASEGLTTFSSCNYTASPAPKTTVAETPTALDDFLLGTPVLKARAPAAPIIEIPSTILKALDSTGGPTPIIENQTSQKRTTGPRSRTRTKEKFSGLNVASAQDKSIGGDVNTKKTLDRREKPKEYKKRKKDELGDSDEELLKRLQERRERKRLKRGIMKSPSKESESEKENPAQSIKKKGDKSKSPRFALMHGFTATNVGKSRITLGPLFRNVGVFKKGRASSTSKTGILTSKKRSDHDVCFSEARFLESAGAKAIKNIIDFESSPSSPSSGGVHKKKISVKRKEKLIVPKKNKEIDEESVEDSNCDDIAGQNKTPAQEEDLRTYGPANSISWDIERESYVEESEVGCRQGTIVLSFPRDAVACEKSHAIAGTPVLHSDTSPGNVGTTSGDSLHPSQSASQVLRGQSKAQGTGSLEQPMSSKYFVPENITKEVDGHERHDEDRRSITLPEPRLERNPNMSMFHQSPPRIEAHFASPTLSPMISLDLVDELPRPYDAFSLADVTNIFEYAAMELDGYGVFHGPDAAQEPDFRSRSDSEHSFEPGRHLIHQPMLENPDSDNVIIMEQNSHYEDPLVGDPSGLPDKCCHQNLDMALIHEGCDGVAVCDWKVDHGPFNAGYMSCETGDNFSGVQQSDIPNLSTPSVDGSSEHDNCVGHFSQGRSLLYGLHLGRTRVSDVEAEVAKLLKQNHWLPHRL